MADMAEHRVPMLGASLRRLEDPARSRDPRVRAVVGALRHPAVAPRRAPDFRAELRAQLVAIAPRIVAESAIGARPSPPPMPTRPRKPVAASAGRGTPTAPSRRCAPFRSAARSPSPLAVVAAFALLLGGAVWMSRKALPGDALYGLKRASENLQLATGRQRHREGARPTSTSPRPAPTRCARCCRAPRRRRRRRPAGRRRRRRTPPASSARTLASADSDVQSASSLLGTQAVASSSPRPLADHDHLGAGPARPGCSTIAAAMPSPAAARRAARRPPTSSPPRSPAPEQLAARLTAPCLRPARAPTRSARCRCSASPGAPVDPAGHRPRRRLARTPAHSAPRRHRRSRRRPRRSDNHDRRPAARGGTSSSSAPASHRAATDAADRSSLPVSVQQLRDRRLARSDRHRHRPLLGHPPLAAPLS